jgi:ribosome-binding protein aMBF1 (putative translation factor)
MYQDWNTIVFNNKPKTNADNKQKPNIQISNQHKKLEPPKDLAKKIQQARTANNLTQKQIAQQLQIAVNTYNLWESGRTIPTNLEIAKIEKLLKIKLPRSRIVKLDADLDND